MKHVCDTKGVNLKKCQLSWHSVILTVSETNETFSRKKISEMHHIENSIPLKNIKFSFQRLVSKNCLNVSFLKIQIIQQKIYQIVIFDFCDFDRHFFRSPWPSMLSIVISGALIAAFLCWHHLLLTLFTQRPVPSTSSFKIFLAFWERKMHCMEFKPRFPTPIIF